jgi:hypothetical protein
MARRPKRINLEAISDTTHKDHKKHSQSLMLDLLRKHPRGPECKLVSADYDHHWSGHAMLSDSQTGDACGYEDLLIYRWCCALNIDGSEWDWKYQVREHWPELGKNGVTRRSRRLAARTEKAYRRVMKAGRPGIYEVRFGNGYRHQNNTMKVWAENSEMAEVTAKINMSATFDNEVEVMSNFEREGCPSELMGLNATHTSQMERLAETKRARIIELQKEIELLELRACMLKTYSIAAVG